MQENSIIASDNNTATSASLDNLLIQSLEEGNMLVCVKDKNKVVLKQNIRCIEVCGNRENESCCDGCMEIYTNDDHHQWRSWGNRTYKNAFLHNSYYDVTLLCSDRHIVTILQPLDTKQSNAIEHYQKMGLTKRELQVISLVIKGLTNLEICEQLSISNATLRTHLNRIYAKAEDTGSEVCHLPRERKQAL